MKASGQGAAAAARDAREAAPKEDLNTYLVKHRDAIEKVKPKHINTDRFLKIVAKAVYISPKLAKCSVKSIFLAALQAAELGLEPNGVLGHGALVPYWNSKKGSFEAQFQTMYKGLVTLAYNTRQFKMIDAREVYQNDYFNYAYGLEPVLEHKPAEGERGEVIGYYAFFILQSGGRRFEYMTKDEVMAWAERYSKAWEDPTSPWHVFPDEMGKKTVLRKALKYAPMSVELPMEPEEAHAAGLDLSYSIDPDETIDGEAEAVEEKKPAEEEEPKKPPKADSDVQPDIF